MRKTTMSETKSNDRAIYDDMFDERLASTLVESGGIGISDTIYEQITQQQNLKTKPDYEADDINSLRELSSSFLKRPVDSEKDNITSVDTGNTFKPAPSTSLKSDIEFVNNIWSTQDNQTLNEKQQAFIDSLQTHANRNARKI